MSFDEQAQTIPLRAAHQLGEAEQLSRASNESGADGVNWWALIAGGTALALIGVPLALALEGVGGVLAAIGGGLALVGVAFGMP